MTTERCVATREAVDELVEERGEVTCPLCDGPASAHQPEEGDPQAIALMGLVDQRAADDVETASDGGEL